MALRLPEPPARHRRGLDRRHRGTALARRRAPPRDNLRRALREWTFSDLIRTGNEPPADLVPIIAWLEQNTVRLADLSGEHGAVLARRILDRISRKADGTMAAANTANRKRMVLSNAMEYACEIGGFRPTR